MRYLFSFASLAVFSLGSAQLCTEGTVLTLSLIFDNYPSDTGWFISDENGNVVAGVALEYGVSGSYQGPTATETMCLEDGCYSLTITDAYFDGMCCGPSGNGSYTLTDQEGNILAIGGEFGSSETTDFCVGNNPNPGCSDEVACNYDPEATGDDGSCNYGQLNFSVTGGEPWISETGLDLIYNESDSLVNIFPPGQFEFGEIINEDFCIPMTGCYYAVVTDSWGDGFAFSDSSSWTLSYNGNEVDSGGGNFGSADTSDVWCFEPGCMDVNASNFNPTSTEDAGGCAYEGCTDPEACNYSNFALTDDQSCMYPTFGYNCNGECLEDNDGDGICNIFEVSGCTDPEACNFENFATESDDSCVFAEDGYNCDGICLEDSDGDGICDEHEEVMDMYNNGFSDGYAAGYEAGLLAGLSNCSTIPTQASCGPGTTWSEFYQLCLPLESCSGDLNEDGVRGVEDLLLLLSYFGTECDLGSEVAEWTCGDAVNYHGYDYSTVQIGEQCWFAENLRSELYSNGDSINNAQGNFDWQLVSEGLQGVYDDQFENLNIYGRLYNWYAANDNRGVCPFGWSVPTDENFKTLEIELGMSQAQADSLYWRGTDQGNQMKSSTENEPSWNGSNSSGFSALPGGMKFTEYSYAGVICSFWTIPTVNGIYMARELHGNGQVYRDPNNEPWQGFSIRCLKDFE